jgi:hypothetical protein
MIEQHYTSVITNWAAEPVDGQWMEPMA